LAGTGSRATSAVGGATGAGSGLAGLGLPDAAALRDASPARRRQLLRQVWNAPLRGRKLRRLREALADYGGCLDDLSAQGRRALVLRAGAGDREPVSRRTIARRLGVSLRRELRVESTALGRLTSRGRQGLCGGGVTPGALGGAGSALAGLLGSRDHWASPDVDERSGVLAASERGGESADDGNGRSLGFIDPPGGAPSALFLLALAILGPLAVALLATRTGGASKRPQA
jgi:hypothetical protein